MENYEVAVVGGGPAGLSAALGLGRSSRKTIVLTDGLHRNRFTSHSNGFFTRDGEAPHDLIKAGTEDLKKYETVQFAECRVTRISRNGEEGSPTSFTLELEGGDVDKITASRIVLATGLKDTMPGIPGLTEIWGRYAHHCVYCDGFEIKGTRLGLLLSPKVPADVHAFMVLAWAGELVVFSQGMELPEHIAPLFEANGIQLVTEKIEEITEESESETISVKLGDGSSEELKGIFVVPETALGGKDLVEQLGVEFDPMFNYIKVNQEYETNVSGVYAAGDTQEMFKHSVVFAASAGYACGIYIDKSLTMGRLAAAKQALESGN